MSVFTYYLKKIKRDKKLSKAIDKHIKPSIKDGFIFKLSDIYALASIIYNVLFKCYLSIIKIIYYLKDINILINNLGLNVTIVWKTLVDLSYNKDMLNIKKIFFKVIY